jgi:capsular exopolysaccharide synthesis family protein
MEPVDYLKIIQRHWKVAAGLVVVALVAVFLASPNQPAQVYEATHTLLRDQASGEEGASSADNPSVVSLWASRGEVPGRVKTTLGYDGPVDELTNRLTVTPDPELGTVEMVATADSSDEAVLLVNTFADELLRFINERDAERVAETKAQADSRVADLDQQIAGFDQQIRAMGGDEAQNTSGIVSQREAAISERASVQSEAAIATAKTKWTSLQKAASAKAESDSVVGASRGQRMLLAVMVSLLLAFGVAIMLDRSDSRLHTKEQAERQFGLPVLAEVPLVSMRSRHRAAVFGYENEPRVAEAYRGLRTALLLFRDRLPLELEAAELSGNRNQRSAEGARQVILVTSPDAGDGKSTTAANLAMAYAEAGQSVLLVCWDLWRPMSARVFDAEDAPGVTEFLAAGNASLVRFVQTTSVPGLHVVTAGALGQQPAGQLDAELRLLEEARSLADVVIIDTAPILAASLTRELVTMADVVILACRAGRTTSPAAERCAELLERLGAPTLGVVLVGVPVGLFKNDYYGKALPRGDRLRNLPVASPVSGAHLGDQPPNADNGREEPSFPSSAGPPTDRTGG